MSQIQFKTKVSKNGISLPANVPLKSGKEVKVTLEWQETPQTVSDAEYDRALKKRMTPEQFKKLKELENRMNAMMAEVELPKDLSQNWNKYLYGRTESQ